MTTKTIEVHSYGSNRKVGQTIELRNFGGSGIVAVGKILTTLAILLQTFLIMVMPRTWRARRFFTAKRNLMNIRIK